MNNKQEEEIKSIYKAGIIEEKSNFDIFKTLTEYYPNAGQPVVGNPDWFKFIKLIKGIKEKMEDAERNIEITDEEAEQMQNRNRKKTIGMLAKYINDIQKKPEEIKDWELTKIMTFYKTIQSAEEAKKKTDIARDKIKTDEKRTVFPYERMSDEEISNLQKDINESFNRIRQDGKSEDR